MTDPRPRPRHSREEPTPIADAVAADLARRRERRGHPLVDDGGQGELEPLLGTPEPENVPQVGTATPEQPQAEGHALQPGEELGAETDAPGTGQELEEVPILAARVVVSAMPSTRTGEQTVIAEVYPRTVGAPAEPVLRWARPLPDPAPLCTDEDREHELVFATGGGELTADGSPPNWQVTLYTCTRCPYAETDDANEPPPTVVDPNPAALEAAAVLAEGRDGNPARAAELRARRDRGGRAVERESNRP